MAQPVIDTTTSGPGVPPSAASITAAPRGAEQADHRISTLTGVQVLACGAYAPPRVVTNAELTVHGYDSDWIVQRTGILERRWAEKDVATSDLAYEAAARCLTQAN